jgi:four helix bundle suffix protein
VDICRKKSEHGGQRCGHGGRGGHDGQSRLDGQVSDELQSSTKSTMSTTPTNKPTTLYSEFSANAALTLIAVACSLLDRQVARLAQDFENEGGFTERLYRVRTNKRKQQYRSK